MTRKRNLDLKRQRARERDIKQQRLDSGLIVITDSDEDQNTPEDEEGFVRVVPVPRYVKPELKRVLHSFQVPLNRGIHISERFRNPSHDRLEDYLPTVLDHTHDLLSLLTRLGLADDPLTDGDREAFSRFATTLESLARRTREAIAVPPPDHLV